MGQLEARTERQGWLEEETEAERAVFVLFSEKRRPEYFHKSKGVEEGETQGFKGIADGEQC